jgi:phage tail-like protein
MAFAPTSYLSLRSLDGGGHLLAFARLGRSAGAADRRAGGTAGGVSKPPGMASNDRDDPYKAFNFLVEIDGIAVAAFSEVSGLESETAVIEYRTGGDKENAVRKLPGLTKHANIVLRRGVTKDAELWNWRRTVVEGRVERRNGAIVLLDDDHTPVLRWTFRAGWISKWTGPELNAKANEVAIETIEIVHEGLSRD